MSESNKNVPQVLYDDVTLVEGKAFLNQKQLNHILKPTPKKYLQERKGKGGELWTYVTGNYVKKALNVVFGFDWDFEVVKYEFDLGIKQCFVLGKLTMRSDGKTIVKSQFGRADIKFRVAYTPDPNNPGKSIKQTTDEPLDLGNDLKAATTDALKKCASEIGIAADVYAKEEFNHINVVSDVSTPDEVFEEIKKFKDVQPLLDWANLKKNIQYNTDPEFKQAVNDKIKELDGSN